MLEISMKEIGIAFTNSIRKRKNNSQTLSLELYYQTGTEPSMNQFSFLLFFFFFFLMKTRNPKAGKKKKM
jgi:hypothetical protein